MLFSGFMRLKNIFKVFSEPDVEEIKDFEISLMLEASCSAIFSYFFTLMEKKHG